MFGEDYINKKLNDVNVRLHCKLEKLAEEKQKTLGRKQEIY